MVFDRTERRSRRGIGAVLLCATLLVAWFAVEHGDADDATVDPVKAAFNAADLDGDRQLTEEEYAAASENPDVARRDFRMFDFNQNWRFSVEEFAAIPGRVPEAQRGAIPDPIDHLFEAALEAMEETLKLGVPDGQATISTIRFGHLVANPIRYGAADSGGTPPDAAFDEDHDNVVTQREIERFLEITLGIRASTGDRLRMADGRVMNYGRFQLLDANDNQKIEPDELGRSQEEFAAWDRDRNGSISLSEFVNADEQGWFDPVVWFRDADTDLDGLLNPEEVRAATGESRHALIDPNLRAFDEDGNGKFSLDEFRMSMLGNPVVSWERRPRDADDDFFLTMQEFRSYQRSAVTAIHYCYDNKLLLEFYFHRLDADGDDRLSRDELPFQGRPPGAMKLLAADGSALLPLYTNAEYPHCGSPAVSPDGQTIAFDGRRAGQDLRQQRILMIDRDGGGFRDVCGGLMPTWSPDGKRFTCSRYEPRNGVWIIDADGSNAQWVAEGWGAQWSPDGRTIAYTQSRSVWAYDVESGESREMLSALKHPYQMIYWNMGWSPDSRRLCFKGRKEDGNDLASISMVGDDPDIKVHVSTKLRIEPDFAWSPDGERILFCMESPDHPNDLLYEINPNTDDPPRLVKGIDTAMFHNDCCFTPDGKWIVVGATESAERGL